MRRLGLLGGMSFESTLTYYRLINEQVRQRLGGLHSAELVLYSVDFATIAILQQQGDWQQAGQRLAAATKALKAAGAEAVVLCTNTMHQVANAIADELPVLHIAEATGQAIQAQGLQTVALLGTAFTMEQAFYRDYLASKFGLKVMIPSASQRQEVHQIIYTELCQGLFLPQSRQRYLDICEDLISQGAQGIILGCTEIALLLPPATTPLAVPLFDTTELHANHAALWALGFVDG